MAGIDQKTLWDFARIVLKGVGDKQQAQPVQAKFLRTDPDGTQWVQLAGSTEETPVNGRTLASAKAGDTVELEISDGVLSLDGNASEPSVGMRSAKKVANEAAEGARRMAADAGRAAELSKQIADAAQQVADAVNQHFFSDTSGIHVTEATQEDWNTNHSGANVLINALGQLFRDGLNNLLTLTTENGARALTIWDGLGNAAGNVVASFSGTEVSLGANSNSSTIDMCGGVFTFEVDNSTPSKPMASIRVNANSGSGVINIPTLRLTAGSGSDEFGFDIAGIGTAQYPISVVAGDRKVVNMGGLGLQTYALDLAGIGGGATVSAYDGIYMVTQTGTNFWSTAAGTVLWSSGGWAMAADQTATLAYNISTCPTGIMLHWQPYTSSTVRNYYHHWQFVPKEQVASYAGTTANVTLSSSKFASVATKTLYVSDNRVTGHADNTATGTANGITYANNQWVLTQIIAV